MQKYSLLFCRCKTVLGQLQPRTLDTAAVVQQKLTLTSGRQLQVHPGHLSRSVHPRHLPHPPSWKWRMKRIKKVGGGVLMEEEMQVHTAGDRIEGSRGRRHAGSEASFFFPEKLEQKLHNAHFLRAMMNLIKRSLSEHNFFLRERSRSRHLLKGVLGSSIFIRP